MPPTAASTTWSRTDDGSFQVVFSLPGAGSAEPDFASLAVSLDDVPLPAEAEPADEAAAVERTTILTIDVSKSMRRDNRFTEAKQAAQAFLDAAPPDLNIGIVTFAGEVEVAQEPTLDRAASTQVLDSLVLTNQTRLYDGILEAVGRERDGRLAQPAGALRRARHLRAPRWNGSSPAIELAQIKVDVVALAQGPEDETLLRQLADAGSGSLITADDPETLTEVFSQEAQDLASQILVTVTPTSPAGRPPKGPSASASRPGPSPTPTPPSSRSRTVSRQPARTRPTSRRRRPPGSRSR